MSISHLDESEFNGPNLPFKGQLKYNAWIQKTKYEENVVKINIRSLDPDGTLRVCKEMDRSLCKEVPEVDIIDGFVVIKIKREK